MPDWMGPDPGNSLVVSVMTREWFWAIGALTVNLTTLSITSAMMEDSVYPELVFAP